MNELKFHQLTKDAGVAKVVLNRPKHNVLNIEMMEELTAVLAELNAEAELTCIVLAGEGPSWCAGVEVSDHKSPTRN